jgi:membrane associated rhomboid family serine protease
MKINLEQSRRRLIDMCATVFDVVRRSGRAQRFPVLTVTALAFATVAAIAQFATPGIVPLLQRDPVGLAHGQWWRVVSPLAVQTLGWYQVLANLVTLAIIGLVAEWLLGRLRWVALFAAGTLGGQVAAYAWHEPGGGDSIAICGLAGGVVVALLLHPSPIPRWAADPVIYYVAALTGWGLRGTRGAAACCVAAVVFLYGMRRLGLGPEHVGLVGAIACVAVLAAVRDLHGASLASGAVMMTALAGARRSAKHHRDR